MFRLLYCGVVFISPITTFTSSSLSSSSSSSSSAAIWPFSVTHEFYQHYNILETKQQLFYTKHNQITYTSNCNFKFYTWKKLKWFTRQDSLHEDFKNGLCIFSIYDSSEILYGMVTAYGQNGGSKAAKQKSCM